MSSIAQAWARLGIDATDDPREVKRAYGRALKAIDPDTDPQAFLDLRQAYETALQWGTQVPYWEDDAPGEEEPAGTTIEPSEEAAGTEEVPDEFWERWRPEPPPEQQGEGLREACLALDALLFDTPPPGPDRIAEAGRAVMEHPELAKVDRLTETERWMAEVISASSPRSDPLIEPAIARFGWKQAGRDWRRNYNVAWVLDRRDDLVFLRQCRKGGHRYFTALEALSGLPPQKLRLAQLGLAGDVAKFLDAIATEHPTLEQDLDPESLAWWRAYLHGRHLPPNFLNWMLAGPVAVTLAAAFVATSRGWPLWVLLPLFALAMAATWGALLGKAELDARARHRRLSQWDGEAQLSGGIERIAGGALLLPPLVSLLPDGSLWVSVSLTASLALASGGLRLGWVEPEWAESNRIRVFLPVVAAVAGLGALATAPASALKLVPPLLALCWLGSRVYAPVRLRLQALPGTVRLSLLGASLACICLAVWPLLRIATGDVPPLWALMIVPSAILAGHFAAAPSTVDVHVIEWPLRVVAMTVYFVTGALAPDSIWLRILVAVAVYGLLYSGISAGAALLTEARRPEREQA